jgi:DNA polymerase (family X)
MENHQIATVFEEIASILRMLQDDPKWQFKAVAYERAKRSIESYPERLEDIARDPDRKLTDVPGVGADLAAKITEILETGKLQYLEEKFAKIPRSLLDLLQIPTVGPQKVRLFYRELGIRTLDEL